MNSDSESESENTRAVTVTTLVLGTVWCIVLGVCNSILSFRTNPSAIPAFLATLLSFPMGKFLAALMQSQFTLKEHVLISIIASAGGSPAYGLDNVIAQRSLLFMGNTQITFLHSVCWIFVTQFLGFGLAGLGRRFLVRPKSMVWPNILSSVALFQSFHSPEIGFSRYKFFWLCVLACFLYSFLPSYFFVALQSFSLLCFLTDNKQLKFLASAGNGYGIGLGALTIDWYYISGAALTTPWWAAVNMAIANLLWGWVLTPIIYYTNFFGADMRLSLFKYPDGTSIGAINTPSLFNLNGSRISAVSLYAKPTYDLNVTAYEMQKPIYISSAFAMAYASNFMAIMAAFMHVYLWHGRDIASRFYESVNEQEQETHIPEKWFLWFLVILVFLQVILSFVSPFSMPVWATLLCVAIAAASVMPIGVIAAVSGMGLGVNVLTEFIIGLLLPGKTIAVMAFKSLGTNSVKQAITLLADLKIGHYLKIDPSEMIFAQLYGSFLGVFVHTTVCFWVMDTFKNLGNGDWQATNYFIFYNAGAIWGAIGPQRFFGLGSVYQSTLLCFLIGLILPVIPYILYLKTGQKAFKFVNIPILASFNAIGSFQNYYISPIIVSWISWRLIKQRLPLLWKKFNYIAAVGLDVGCGLCVLTVTIMAHYGIYGKLGPANPDISKGVPIDYYCMEMEYHK